MSQHDSTRLISLDDFGTTHSAAFGIPNHFELRDASIRPLTLCSGQINDELFAS